MDHPDRDLPIDCIEEARLDFADRLPPFIQHNTRCVVNSRQTIILPTASGNLPQPYYRKQAELVCRAWNSSSTHKFWTYDHDHTRYIVKGFFFDKMKGRLCPHLVFYVWSGREGMRLDPKKEGFGIRVIALCFVEDAEENFSFDNDEESLIQPHRRTSGRQTRNSLATSDYTSTDLGSNDGQASSSGTSQKHKRNSLAPTATSPSSSDDEPLINRPRRLHRPPPRISRSSSGSDIITLNSAKSRGTHMTVNVRPLVGSETLCQPSNISNPSPFTNIFPEGVSTVSPLQLHPSVDLTPAASLPNYILNQTVLHISSSASKRGAVPIYLSSCPTMELFYARIAASWRIQEHCIEDVTATFGWLEDGTPMVLRKEIEDSFRMLLETVQDAPCWTAEISGRKRCEVMVMIHLKENISVSKSPVINGLGCLNSQAGVKREIIDLD